MTSLLLTLPGETNFLVLQYKFESQPAQTLHPDWAARLIPFEGSWWQESPALPHISKFLTNRLDLKPPYRRQRESPAYRLACLPVPTLVELTRLAGCVLFASQLRKVIDGSVLRELNEVIGDGFFNLIRSLAPFLLREDSLGPIERLEDETWLEAIDRVGTLCLASATKPLGQSVNARLSLKFSPQFRSLFETEAVLKERDCFLLLKKLLVREVDPSWTALF